MIFLIKIVTEFNYRKMRNSAAHLDMQHTKEQAENAVAFVKSLIQRNS